MTQWREEAKDADLKTIDQMTLMWTNFAKHGYATNFLHNDVFHSTIQIKVAIMFKIANLNCRNPTPDNGLPAVWDPVELKTRNQEDVVTRFLEIGGDLKMHQNSMNEERMKFWSQLLKTTVKSEFGSAI